MFFYKFLFSFNDFIAKVCTHKKYLKWFQDSETNTVQVRIQWIEEIGSDLVLNDFSICSFGQ